MALLAGGENMQLTDNIYFCGTPEGQGAWLLNMTMLTIFLPLRVSNLGFKMGEQLGFILNSLQIFLCGQNKLFVITIQEKEPL